jgi:hypothetical protein
LAVGVAVPSLAFAQDTTATPSASASASPTNGTHKPGGAHAGQNQDELATALAKELGIDKDKVAAALAKIQTEREANRPKPNPSGTPSAGAKADRTADLKSRLAAAVSAGKLTQAEADAIIKAADAGVLLGGPGGGHAPGK